MILQNDSYRFVPAASAVGGIKPNQQTEIATHPISNRRYPLSTTARYLKPSNTEEN
jgi:hypothetical protein